MKGGKEIKIKLLQVREATGGQASSPRQVADLMREEAQADREAFWVLHLNTQNAIIEKELVSLGTLDASYVHPREVFKKAIILSTKAIITAHNHPSGNPLPSNNDQQVWDKLKASGDLLDIPVLDNLIITPTGAYYSDKERNVVNLKGGKENG